MSYQVSPAQAVESAGKLLKEGACESVKLEGGLEVAEHAHRIVRAGIPVVGHVGLAREFGQDSHDLRKGDTRRSQGFTDYLVAQP